MAHAAPRAIPVRDRPLCLALHSQLGMPVRFDKGCGLGQRRSSKHAKTILFIVFYGPYCFCPVWPDGISTVDKPGKETSADCGSAGYWNDGARPGILGHSRETCCLDKGWFAHRHGGTGKRVVKVVTFWALSRNARYASTHSNRRLLNRDKTRAIHGQSHAGPQRALIAASPQWAPSIGRWRRVAERRLIGAAAGDGAGNVNRR